MLKFFIKYIPTKEALKESKYLKWLGEHLHSPNLWHLNRRSVSGAVSAGIFVAWLPIPFQMVVSACFSVLFRINMPIAVGLVWITNPLTMPFLFYFSYKVGTRILGITPTHIDYHNINFHMLMDSIATLGPPLLIGSLFVGAICSVIGYFVTSIIWRQVMLARWEKE